MQDNTPLVSVIVPTYNSERTLALTLASVKSQTYPNIELIVIDNNSKDTTKKIAEKYADKVLNKGPERTAQKNFGIENAKGKYFLFIDGDMSLDKELITDCVEKIETKKMNGGVIIPVVDTGSSFWTKVIAFERSFYKGSAVEAARFLDAELVKKVGGFKDIVCYEEFIVPQQIEKLGYTTKNYTKYNIYHDYDDFTFLLNLKKKFYYGKSLNLYKKQMKDFGLTHPSSQQTSVFDRYMIFFRSKRFWQSPLLALGVILLKTCEFGAGGLGMGVCKLRNIKKFCYK